MTKKKSNPYTPRVPVINDGTKTCMGECGHDLPATSDYFDRDESKADKLRTVCKACRVMERERAENKLIDARITQLDKGALKLLDTLTRSGSDIPHIAEVYQRLMDVYEGAGGYAAHFMAQYLMAKPGSTTRTKMLEMMMRIAIKVSESGAAKVPIELLGDEDLEIVLEQGAKKYLRLTHDNGEVKEAS
jgi:hypothetical protein